FLFQLDNTFMSRNEGVNARDEIKVYSQEKGVTAEEYFVQFEQLARKAGYDESIHWSYLQTEIEQGVWNVIINQMYSNKDGVPDNYTEYKDQVITLDNLKRQRMEQEARNKPSNEKKTPATTGKAHSPQGGPSQQAAPATTTTTTPAPGKTYGGLGQPM